MDSRQRLSSATLVWMLGAALCGCGRGGGAAREVPSGAPTPGDAASDTLSPPSSSGAPDPQVTVAPGASCPLGVGGVVPAVPAGGCPGLCGNGRIDTCVTESACPGPSCQRFMSSDVCDGAVPAGQSCASLGFAGGTLACSKACGLDTAPCAACVQDSRIARCVRLTGVHAQAFALASKNDEVALAWLERQPEGGGELRARFALLSAELEIKQLGDCFGVAAWTSIALAPTPSGWAVALDNNATSGSAVGFYLLDELGRPAADPQPLIPGASRPTLAARPTGGPLLLYGNTASLRDEKGVELWRREVQPGTVEWPTAVYTGDGFLWAGRVGSKRAVTVARLELDGTVSAAGEPVAGDQSAPALVWTDSGAGLVWSGGWARLDRTGALLGAPVALDGAIPGAVSAGDGTIVLMHAEEIAPMNPRGHLRLGRLDATGNFRTPLFPVLWDGHSPVAHAIVRAGNRAIIGQITDNPYEGRRLFLASVRPD